MRFTFWYLAVYFLLIVGALVALALGGALTKVPFGALALALIVAVGLGVLFAVAWRRPPTLS